MSAGQTVFSEGSRALHLRLTDTFVQLKAGAALFDCILERCTVQVESGAIASGCYLENCTVAGPIDEVFATTRFQITDGRVNSVVP